MASVPPQGKAGTPSMRSYVRYAVKAATHPVRTEILKILKEGPKSTTDLESATGRNRYDIYHHLDVLENAGLIDHRVVGGKAKEFRLKESQRPEVAVVLVEEDAIREQPEAFTGFLDNLEKLEGAAIPNRDRINRAEVILSYTWRRKASGRESPASLREGGGRGSETPFAVGHDYTRREIHARLGGGVQDFLPNVKGKIVCACLKSDLNPSAPEVILVGLGPGRRRSAELLCHQGGPIPVFIWRGVNAWTYRGLWRVERWSDRPEEIQRATESVPPTSVSRVIWMREVPHHRTAPDDLPSP